MRLLVGDCLDKLKEIEDCTIDSVVTDPPYGLSFMGKKWDYDVPSIAIWKEVLRVLKPGGHLLSFGGTRTYHRLAVNIEDAGFEIRDQIQWIYGSGFPKSHNIKEGEFAGYGTALKPANEPIVVARKPLEKGLTVAQNVLKYGTGAINIDASRIGTDKVESGRGGRGKTDSIYEDGLKSTAERTFVSGRWPANILFDEEAAAMLDEQSGINASRFFYCAKASKSERNAGLAGMAEKENHRLGPGIGRADGKNSDNKRPSSDQNNHPTVKPIKLMEYLITLVTQPSGIVLDPFMGSGSTGVAAKALCKEFIGIEMSEEYFEIAKKRINELPIVVPLEKAKSAREYAATLSAANK